ncbi:hypothetical protein GCM10010429_04950 [Micromonospora olivasterospora]
MPLPLDTEHPTPCHAHLPEPDADVTAAGWTGHSHPPSNSGDVSAAARRPSRLVTFSPSARGWQACRMGDGKDWYDWRLPYADPGSPLARRLRLVQRHIASWLDERPDASLSVVSVCAGQGHDLLGVPGRAASRRAAGAGPADRVRPAQRGGGPGQGGRRAAGRRDGRPGRRR